MFAGDDVNNGMKEVEKALKWCAYVNRGLERQNQHSSASVRVIFRAQGP
jgi:hypothetical protein